MKNVLKLIIAVAGCELVGVAATPFTISAIDNWYRFLNKPFFSPPNYVFGPVWALLYFLMGVSVYLIWLRGLKNPKVKDALVYFLAQLFFNFCWSIAFFALKSPTLAFFDIIVLWLLVVITTSKFFKISKVSAYLLIPYLLWVTFAAILNLAIVVLN